MDEAMFKRLLFAGADDENIGELIDLGYLKRKNGTICRTNKYQVATDKFISQKKEHLFKAIERLGNADDIKKIMEAAGIKDYVTFIFVAEELIKDGKLIKGEGNKWLIK